MPWWKLAAFLVRLHPMGRSRSTRIMYTKISESGPLQCARWDCHTQHAFNETENEKVAWFEHSWNALHKWNILNFTVGTARYQGLTFADAGLPNTIDREELKGQVLRTTSLVICYYIQSARLSSMGKMVFTKTDHKHSGNNRHWKMKMWQVHGRLHHLT